MNPFVPVVALAAVALAFGVLLVTVSWFVGPRRYNRVRREAYECGIQPTPHAEGGGRFPIRYYLTAMTFIIFDIEIIFLYPWAVHASVLGMFGMVAAMTFLLLITVPYIYEYRRGGLDWE